MDFDIPEMFGMMILFILANLVTFCLTHPTEFVRHLLNANHYVCSKITGIGAYVCTVASGGVLLARCSWIYLKFKVLKMKPVEIVPTIKIDRVNGKLQIEYTYKERPFKLISRMRRGPSKFVQFMDGEKDVTEVIRPYLGHNDDFHGIRYTPADLGFSSLSVLDIFGELQNFANDDFIVLT
jgi:hypothetical protein